MRFVMVILLLLGMGLLLTCAGPQSDLGIMIGTVIDGTGNEARRDLIIIVNGTIIQDVIPKSEFKPRTVQKLIDASDKYLIPPSS